MGRPWKEWRKIERYNKTDEQLKMDFYFNGQIDSVYRELWSHNVAEAVKHKLPYISDLYGTRSGSALVCGAGPSLLREAEQIIEAQRRGWDIVCTDRALKMVRDMGVREAFSVTTECQPECGDFLLSAGRGDMAVVNLISCPETRNTLLERGAMVFHTAPMNPVSTFWNYCYNEDFLGDDVGCNRQHIVVTFSAVDICYWMGYDQIVTVGNDLCYETPESCVEDAALLLHNAYHVYPVYEDPHECVMVAEGFHDGKSTAIRRLSTGEWTFGSIRRLKRTAPEVAKLFVLKNKHRLQKRSDAGSGGICRVKNGTRWSFESFVHAANGFQLFYLWHPEDKRVFRDASGGVASWIQTNLKELLGADIRQEKVACG